MNKSYPHWKKKMKLVWILLARSCYALDNTSEDPPPAISIANTSIIDVVPSEFDSDTFHMWGYYEYDEYEFYFDNDWAEWYRYMMNRVYAVDLSETPSESPLPLTADPDDTPDASTHQDALDATNKSVSYTHLTLPTIYSV